MIPIDEVRDDLIEAWHAANGINGIELHQFLGCTEDEYAAWFGPTARPLPERLHGYWRWLHALLPARPKAPVHEPGEEPLPYWEREARRAVAGHTAMSANVLVMHLRDAMVEVDRLRAELVEVQPPGHHVDIVFDGPPGAVSGRFVEVEDETGKSIRLGTWVERADGFWALRITPDQECCRFCTDPHTEGAEPVHTHGEDCCEYIPPGYMIREDPDHGEMLVPITEGDRRA